MNGFNAINKSIEENEYVNVQNSLQKYHFFIEKRTLSLGENSNLNTVFHWHNSYELEIVLDGSAEHYFNTDSPYRFRAGDVVLCLPKKDVHTFYLEQDRILKTYTLIFDNTYLRRETFLKLNRLNKGIILSLSKQDANDIVSLMSMIEREQRFGSNINDSIISDLFDIIILFLLRSKQGTDDQKISNYIVRTKSFIEDANDRFVSLQEIANHLGVSADHLGRIIKKEIGISFNDYQKTFKSQKAAEMLVNTDKTITDIAESVGFSNTSFFSKCFRRIYKVSPLEYRHIYKNGDVVFKG